MNAHNRNHFTDLLPCRLCGMEPMRVYCNSTDLYAVKCDCGRRTNGFTTIAGASRSWNSLNKKEPPVRIAVPQAAREKGFAQIINLKGRIAKT